MCYNVKRMCIKSSPKGRGVNTVITLMAWKTFKLIAIKNIARRSTVHSFIILAHKKHFILWSNTQFGLGLLP